MANLIDRKSLIENLNYFAPEHYTALINLIIEKEPTVDAVEVVRCCECRHYVANYCTRDIKGRTNMFYMPADAFCSFGVRKGSE